jgi:UDP-glucose 4-epimerase
MIEISALKEKRVLVTGASSFIGSRLCLSIAGCGAIVYAMVRRHTPSLKLLFDSVGVISITGSNATIDSVLSGLGSIDIVYHLGWAGIGAIGRSDARIQALNFAESQNLLMQSKIYGCQLFLFAGSQAEYGNIQGELINESTACRPETEYGKAKLRFSNACIDYCDLVGMECRVMRIFSVYGPGDHPWTLISSLISALKSHQVFHMSTCKQDWNYLYVDDAVNAMIALSSSNCPSGIYNIGSQITQPLKRYVEIISDFFPESPRPKFGHLINGSEASINPSIDKLLRYTDWRENYSFKSGIRKLLRCSSWLANSSHDE